MYDINFVLPSFACLFLTFDWLGNTENDEIVWTYLPTLYHFPHSRKTVQKSESILKKFRKFVFKVRNSGDKFRQFGVSLQANKHQVKYIQDIFGPMAIADKTTFFLRQLWTLAERDFVWISSFNWIKVRIQV